MPSSTPVVGLHLDLKYFMPRKAYLQQWVQELPGLGINTLMIEYEDKFPFSKYPFIQGEGAFTPQELRAFLDAARGAGLAVIPLVQTLSHLEFALTHEQLAHLRELPDIPTQINTSSPEAIQFVHDLIEEVLAYHEPDTYFCLGGDETWHLGHNADTARVLQQKGKFKLWVDHEKPFIKHVMDAGKRPILWDDLFWSDPSAAGRTDLPREVILASWGYAMTKASDNTRKRIQAYHAGGFEAWAAPCLNWGVMVPQHDHCLGNTTAWAEIVKRESMGGMMNTAWACFSVLPHAQALQIAATGEAAKNPLRPLDADWQVGMVEDYFGCPAADVPEALRALGELYEVPVPGLARPLTPVVYGYMDLLLYFGTIEKRMAWGAFPLDSPDFDIVGLTEQKVRLIRSVNGDGKVTDRLAQLAAGYEVADRTCAALAAAATRHRNEAAYLAMVARTKALHAPIISALIRDEPVTRAQADAWLALRETMEQVLGDFIEGMWVPKLMRLWWEPTAALLAKAPATT